MKIVFFILFIALLFAGPVGWIIDLVLAFVWWAFAKLNSR